MVKITNGTSVFEVTRGAYEGIYLHQGYSIAGSDTNHDADVPKETEQTEDEKFVSEITEKPVAQWSKDDVKRYAEIMGIDITGTKNVNEAKDRIKNAMANE